MEKAFQRQERKQDDGFNNSLACENCPFKSLCIVSSLWDFLGVNCLMFRSDLTLNCAGVIFPNKLNFILPNITVIFMCTQWPGHLCVRWDSSELHDHGRLLAIFVFCIFRLLGSNENVRLAGLGIYLSVWAHSRFQASSSMRFPFVLSS